MIFPIIYCFYAARTIAVSRSKPEALPGANRKQDPSVYNTLWPHNLTGKGSEKMDRREAMRGLAIMFGAELLLPIRAAVAQGIDPVDLSGASLFPGDMREQTAAFAETIIPETDTPGAREAGVADFIEFMLQEWYPDEDRERFMDGMAGLQSFCRERHQQTFSELNGEDQFNIVAALRDGQAAGFEDGGQAFFNHMKQLTIFGYYTSEIGMTVERSYLPVPGKYDGAYPYENVRTLFTS
jgi:hypothetical protein